MGHLQIWLLAGLATMGMMTLLWLLSLLLRNSSIVDIFWGAGFILAAWMYYVLTPDGFAGRKLLVCWLVTIWGLRLSLYILWRNWGKPEDYRYAAWRRESGPRWWWVSFFKVFLLQGALLWFISAPLLAAQISPAPANFIWLDGLATLVWGLGFFFEAVGDWQLARLKLTRQIAAGSSPAGCGVTPVTPTILAMLPNGGAITCWPWLPGAGGPFLAHF